jgi:hypothetical protein
MHRIKISAIFLVAALCAAAQKADRQGTTYVSNSMGFSNGVTAKATIAVEPPAPVSVFENKGFSISTTTGDVYHRWIVDDSQRGYFGYDIGTERIQNTDRIRVTITPLSLTVDELEVDSRAKKLSGFRFLVLPHYPPPLVVENGDTIALDLLVSADGKQKIVDYIKISYKSATKPKR